VPPPARERKGGSKPQVSRVGVDASLTARVVADRLQVACGSSRPPEWDSRQIHCRRGSMVLAAVGRWCQRSIWCRSLTALASRVPRRRRPAGPAALWSGTARADFHNTIRNAVAARQLRGHPARSASWSCSLLFRHGLCLGMARLLSRRLRIPPRRGRPRANEPPIAAVRAASRQPRNAPTCFRIKRGVVVPVASPSFGLFMPTWRQHLCRVVKTIRGRRGAELGGRRLKKTARWPTLAVVQKTTSTFRQLSHTPAAKGVASRHEVVSGRPLTVFGLTKT
jgi:hypothetical protein